MAVFNGAFPILPGKEQGGRDFAAACMGERRTKEIWRRPVSRLVTFPIPTTWRVG